MPSKRRVLVPMRVNEVQLPNPGQTVIIRGPTSSLKIEYLDPEVTQDVLSTYKEPGHSIPEAERRYRKMFTGLTRKGSHSQMSLDLNDLKEEAKKIGNFLAEHEEASTTPAPASEGLHASSLHKSSLSSAPSAITKEPGRFQMQRRNTSQNGGAQSQTSREISADNTYTLGFYKPITYTLSNPTQITSENGESEKIVFDAKRISPETEGEDGTRKSEQRPSFRTRSLSAFRLFVQRKMQDLGASDQDPSTTWHRKPTSSKPVGYFEPRPKNPNTGVSRSTVGPHRQRNEINSVSGISVSGISVQPATSGRTTESIPGEVKDTVPDHRQESSDPSTASIDHSSATSPPYSKPTTG